MAFPESAYTLCEREFQDDEDALWEYLENHKYDDPTLCIGWAIKHAKRYRGKNQAAVADTTAVYSDGKKVKDALSPSFISAILGGRSKVSPLAYRRIAAACDVNPLHFLIAEGWVDFSELAAFDMPENTLALPIIQKFFLLPQKVRPSARAVILSVLDSIIAVQP